MVAAILTLRIATDTAFVLVRTWKADIHLSRWLIDSGTPKRPWRMFLSKRAVLLVLSGFIVACHRAVPMTSLPAKNVGPAPIVQDTGGVIAFFKDTGPVVNFPETRTFNLQTPGQRDSLRTALSGERALWRASSPPDYRFLARTGCFCPGVRGWLLIEVRRGQPLRAWDRAGRSAALSDWDTFSIDGLFDMLERSADHDAAVQVSFDPGWHFPTYIYTRALPGPDMWAVIEARGLRPI